MKKIFCCYFFLFTTFWAHAENTNQLILDDSSFNENYNSNVPVSGRVIAGLMLETKKLGSFNINLPKITANAVCFKVQSIDGTYRSVNQYKVIDNKTGNIEPEYPTKYNDIINQFSSQELAILALEGRCSDRKLNNVLVSSRGNTQQDNLVILVSSGRSEVFLNKRTEAGRKTTKKCHRIEQGKRTAYDTICKTAVDTMHTGSNELSILRRKGGRMLPPVKFNVLFTNE